MKINRVEYLIRKGNFTETDEFKRLYNDVISAIKSVKWPSGSDKFEIAPLVKGNGVKPIKQSCMDYLVKAGWNLEERLELGSSQIPGPVDAVFTLNNFKFAVEWETGNISSSHRAINKMALGLLNRTLIGGLLIVPSKCLYTYLTDRVGNFPELEPYFPFWRKFNELDIHGVIGVIEVEYDCINENAPKINKGTDGRALR